MYIYISINIPKKAEKENNIGIKEEKKSISTNKFIIIKTFFLWLFIYSI